MMAYNKKEKNKKHCFLKMHYIISTVNIHFINNEYNKKKKEMLLYIMLLYGPTGLMKVSNGG